LRIKAILENSGFFSCLLKIIWNNHGPRDVVSMEIVMLKHWNQSERLCSTESNRFGMTAESIGFGTVMALASVRYWVTNPNATLDAKLVA
jgi:hypothetical protein